MRRTLDSLRQALIFLTIESVSANTHQMDLLRDHLARARASDLNFSLDDGNAPAVAAICRSLDMREFLSVVRL